MLIAGLRKERGREREDFGFPGLPTLIHPQLWPKGGKNARHGEKLNQESAHLGACLLSQFAYSSIGLSDIKEAVNRPTG